MLFVSYKHPKVSSGKAFAFVKMCFSVALVAYALGHTANHFAPSNLKSATEFSGIAFGACWLFTISTLRGVFELARESSKQ